MNIEIKKYKSRAKEGRASFCVDTRFLGDAGSQKFFKTKSEALAYADSLSQEISPNAGESWDWSFKQLCDSYILHIDSEFEDGEIKRSNMIEKKRHAKCFVGLKFNNGLLSDTKVRDLTPGQIKLDLMKDLKQGRTTKTVRNILGNVRVMMDYAIDKGCRNSNPSLGIKAKGSKGDGKGLVAMPNPETIDLIISHMTPAWALRAELAATTGLRQGEQRALEWPELLKYDFKKIQIDKAVEHRGDVGDTKTKAGVRKVSVPDDNSKSQMQIKMKEYWLAQGRPMTGLVFPSRTGCLLSDSRFLAAIHKACDAAGVQRIRWHDLRHYYASVLLKTFKNDWWTITNLMGHKSIKTTTEIYGHWLDDEEHDAEVSNAISGAF